MPRYENLPAALAARGLRVETVPGWKLRGSPSFAARGSVSHWTAGPRRGDRPSLHVCTVGRPDVPGPLCNVFLTRAGVAVVVAVGRANHAGKGGAGGLVGNSSVFGTEAECSGDGDWTPEQLDAYPRILAAYVDLGAAREKMFGHYQWAPTRKIDPRDVMVDLRADALALLDGEAPPAPTPPPDTAPLEDLDMIRVNIDQKTGKGSDRHGWTYLIGPGIARHLDGEGDTAWRHVPIVTRNARQADVMRSHALASTATALLVELAADADQAQATLDALPVAVLDALRARLNGEG